MIKKILETIRHLRRMDDWPGIVIASILGLVGLTCQLWISDFGESGSSVSVPPVVVIDSEVEEPPLFLQPAALMNCVFDGLGAPPRGCPMWVRRDTTIAEISEFTGIPEDTLRHSTGCRLPEQIAAGTTIILPEGPWVNRWRPGHRGNIRLDNSHR